MPGKRKNWVDSLRALAMILVVVGHTTTAEHTYFALTAAGKMPLLVSVRMAMFIKTSCDFVLSVAAARVRRSCIGGRIRLG